MNVNDKVDELDCRRRQLDEVEALRAVYGFEQPDDFVVNEGDEEGIELARVIVASCDDGGVFSNEGLPMHTQVRIVRRFPENPDLSHTVRLTLPCFYPSERALCTVEWPKGSRAQHEYINGTLGQLSASLADRSEEACYELLLRAEELIGDEVRERLDEEAARACVQESILLHAATEASNRPVRVKRVLLFFHHIIAESKRQACRQWAVQLNLGGYSKIGWPGIVVVEGEEANCDTYVRSLKRLQWQRMEVRGEEVEEAPPGTSIDSLRRLHFGFEELDQSGMSILAERCREAGLESLFLTSLK